MGRALGPLLIILLLLVVPAASMAAGTERIIVKRASGASGAEIRAGAGLKLVRRLPLPRTELVRASDARAALRRLDADPDVVYAEPDRRVHAVVADAFFSSQWALQNTGQLVGDVTGTPDADIDAPAAWALNTGLGRTVAVIDSGVDRTHPDLTARIRPGLDWVDRDTDANDTLGHGTRVSGILVAARGDVGKVVGVAPDARLIPLRVLDADGGGFTSDIVAAYDVAGDLGIRVVNASFGAASSSATEREALAAHPETLFVAAAGNHDGQTSARAYPCAYALANVLCVGASDQHDAPATFSNTSNVDVDLFAPGDNIWTDSLGSGYALTDGTSMAAPHVAGVAAQLLERDPSLTTAQLRAALLATADARPALSGHAVTGGRVNAESALVSVPADRDGDGVDDAIDNCPTIANPVPQSDACGPGAPVTDRDGDGVADGDDKCPDERGLAPDACPSAPRANTDHDALVDVFDACPAVPGTGPDGCPPPPPPPDRDADGVADDADRCPDVASSPTGCPPPPPPPADADGDGRIDAQDACPGEPAQTSTGCPVPALVTLTSAVNGRRAKVRAVADRAADVLFKIERRRCTAAGCRWKRVVRESAQAPTGGVTLKLSGLRRGRYRATVRLSSPAGDSPLAYERFRIRP